MFLVDYGFILAFFVILAGFIFIIARAQATGEQAATSIQEAKTAVARKPIIEYGIIAMLFGFFLLLTVMTERHSASSSR